MFISYPIVHSMLQVPFMTQNLYIKNKIISHTKDHKGVDSMSKYKFHRVFRRYSISYALVNLFITVAIWLFLLSIDIIKYAFKGIYSFGMWSWNKYHFRDINLSHKQIIRLIRNMSPREFEVFIAEMFKTVGYEVELTPETCDGGKDLILYARDGRKIYVEMKHYSENNFVGREICQKITGAMTIDGADECIVVTTGRFNNNALECSNKYKNLTLMDLNDIMFMLKRIDVHLIPRLFVKTFNGNGRKLALEY